MATVKPDLTRVWANGAPSGNVVDPDTTTPGKVLAGWQAEVPPFEHFNFLQKWFSQGLAYNNEQGINIWDIFTTYPIGGISKGSNGKLYIAITEQSGNNPTSDSGVNWISFSTASPLIFQTLSDALDSKPINYQGTIDWSEFLGFTIKTTYFSSASKLGGADYIVKTLTQATADGDVIDGDGTVGVNHAIDATYVLILKIQGKGINALNCGAYPSAANNQLALQAWLDFDYPSKYLPDGIFLSDNLTIPNRTCDYHGDGRFQSTIKSIASPTNSDYLIASAAYVNNSTSGNDPIQWSGIRVWSDGPCDNALVWYGYGSIFDKGYFWSQGSGDALVITGNGISGSTSSGTLVENKIKNNIIRGNFSNGSFAVRDTGNKLTDMFIQSNIMRDGDIFIQTTAGANITDNHMYGSASIDVRGMSVGTLIADNYVENEIEFNNCLDESVVIGPGNNFNGRVTYSFGASGKRMTSKSNRYYGIADIFHNFFGSDKLLYSLNDTFETATPYNFSNPGSTGRITAKDCHAYNLSPDGALLEGSRTGATGGIRNVWWNSSAPTSGNWVRGDIVHNFFPTVDANNMILVGHICTVTGTPGTWVPMYISTVSPAT